MPTNESPTSVPAEISKKRKRVTGRPLIKMEDAVLVDKITKMQNQHAEPEGGRAVAAGDPQRPPRQARARDEVPRARRHGGGGAFRELCMIRV